MDKYDIEEIVNVLADEGILQERNKSKAIKRLSFHFRDRISVSWTIEDVREAVCKKRLSKKICREILHEVRENHNAEYGICWLCIEDTAKDIIAAKKGFVQ